MFKRKIKCKTKAKGKYTSIKEPLKASSSIFIGALGMKQLITTNKNRTIMRMEIADKKLLKNFWLLKPKFII